jgi:hypothetical protein
MRIDASLQCVADVLELIGSRILAPNILINASEKDLMRDCVLSDVFNEDGHFGTLVYDRAVFLLVDGVQIPYMAWVPDSDETFTRKDGSSVRVKAIISPQDSFRVTVVLSTALIFRR